jgi:hypothetical protein
VSDDPWEALGSLLAKLQDKVYELDRRVLVLEGLTPCPECGAVHMHCQHRAPAFGADRTTEALMRSSRARQAALDAQRRFVEGET